MRQKSKKEKAAVAWNLKPGHLTIPTTSALPLSFNNQTTISTQATNSDGEKIVVDT